MIYLVVQHHHHVVKVSKVLPLEATSHPQLLITAVVISNIINLMLSKTKRMLCYDNKKRLQLMGT